MEWIYRRVMQSRRARNLSRRAGDSAVPIISIGNLTTGGTGKTPAVQWLVDALLDMGYSVGIAARGYGGTASNQGALVSDGQSVFLTAKEAGDEAVLHARNFPTAIVAIAKDRHRAVELCQQKGAQIVVLDDGFQFWSLPRQFDLVLMDARKPLGNGHLLPWGRLREEPQALERAGAVVLTRSDLATAEELDFSLQELNKYTSAPVFYASHAPHDLRNESTGEIVGLDYLKRREVKAFAGLANNAQFYSSLTKLGVTTLVKLRREHGDHHSWTPSDFQWAQSAPSINQHQKELFDALPVITTEKDAVKLRPSWFDGPLFSLRIQLKIERENELLRAILGSLSTAPPL